MVPLILSHQSACCIFSGDSCFSCWDWEKGGQISLEMTRFLIFDSTVKYNACNLPVFKKFGFLWKRSSPEIIFLISQPRVIVRLPQPKERQDLHEI